MEDELNHLMGLQAEEKYLEYYVLAAWKQERDGIQSADEMEEYMKKLSVKVNTPLRLSYQEE